MRSFNYAKTRLVTLTLDRDIVGCGEDAYQWSKTRKSVDRFIQKLKRSGIIVEDWTCNLEWHKDGTPHWHLLIQVSESGRAGQLGQALIHKCWPFGRVHETFFKTEKDYVDFLGYMGKTGYLHIDKHYQIELPQRALAMKKINRFSSMLRPDRNTVEADSNGLDDKTQETKARAYRSYQERHAACGQSTEFWHISPDGSRRLEARLNIPYKEIIGIFDGGYVSGGGYVLSGNIWQLLPALNRFTAGKTLEGYPARHGENGPHKSSSELGQAGYPFPETFRQARLGDSFGGVA